tara:strand:- start:579 stop:812 length:234 start_codon:yes stop_codon:yes gene_type:complete
MLPFTYEMFNVYQRYKKQNQIYKNYEFDYQFAIAQLTDESTDGDYEEVNYLKECMDRNCIFTPEQLKLINDYKKALQ